MDKIRNIVAFAGWRIKTNLATYSCTLIGAVLLLWWNVKCKGKVVFAGLPIIIKHHKGRIDIGKNCVIKSASWSNTAGVNRRCLIQAWENATIIIGDGCGLSGAVISAMDSITIGDRVNIGVNCTLLDCDRHSIDAASRFTGDSGNKAPIVIGDDVWLGMNVTVLKGVTVGAGTIVAANSVVTRSLPANVIAGGSPARVLKKVEP
jgi:acetyltransferase-like isoleucine patch superfamily enzyme